MGKKVYKEVRENISTKMSSFTAYDIEGDIESVIRRLTDLRDQAYEKGYENVYLDLDTGYNNIDLEIIGIRKENDKERDKRLLEAKQRREKKSQLRQDLESRELKELARLREKYGDL